MKNKDQEIKRLIRTYEDLFIACATNIPMELLMLRDPTDAKRTINTTLEKEIDKLRFRAVGLRDEIYPNEKDTFRLPRIKDIKRKSKGESE